MLLLLLKIPDEKRENFDKSVDEPARTTKIYCCYHCEDTENFDDNGY